RDALRRQPDLVGRAQRARDDECPAGDLPRAGGRAGLRHGPLGAGAARARLHAMIAVRDRTLPVLKPFRLAGTSPPALRLNARHGVLIVLALAIAVFIGDAQAQPGSATPSILETLFKWTPLLGQGFALDVAMSFLAMGIGIVAGVFVGLALLSLR